LVIQRHTRYATTSTRAVTAYRPRWVDAWFSEKPKIVLKSARPFVPPRRISLRLKTSHAESASACVMIEKYTPRIRLRNARKPKASAKRPGTSTIAASVNAPE